jgi:arylsulfatase A-like enzyme
MFRGFSLLSCLLSCLLAWGSISAALAVEATTREPTGPDATGPDAAPNIVLILSDDQAWNDYGFMGHAAIETPALDRLASESLLFTRGYVPSSLCSPSLASIVTGLYPRQHGIVGNDPADPQDRARLIACIDRVDTLPRLLAAADYCSLQTGKWWLGNYRRGGFTEGMTRGYPEPGGRHGDDGLVIGREGLAPIWDFVDRALERSQPFLVWYAPFLPHTPHNPPPRLLAKYRERTDSLPIAKYWAMCEWFDETCGTLLAGLDDRGLTENTIVVYVTDNGWINLPDRSAYAPKSKRSPYDGGIRTPLMIRWPRRVEPQRDDKALATSLDIVPTLLAACNVEPRAELPGVNLLDHTAVAARNQLFGEIFAHDVADVNDPATSLRYRWTIRGAWKLILPHAALLPGELPELYRIAEDPHEERNLAADEPELVAELKAAIEAAP